MALHDPQRRSFLKLGLAGSAVLSMAGVGGALSGCGARSLAAAQGFGYLRDGDLAMFRALIPAVLKGQSVSVADIETLLKGIDFSGQSLGVQAQAEVRKLFDLLQMPLTRRFVAGLPHDWKEASLDEVGAFLERWRSSGIGLFNAGYRALDKFVTVTWYGLPQARAGTGYPGPLDFVYRAVNR